MNIKTPVVYDTSHWRTVPNFADVRPFPFLVITKATEGASYIDPTFTRYFTDLKQDGIHRGAFHFHRKAVNAATQAQHFCNTIRPHVTNDDLLILDVEEGGETAAQLKTWFEYCIAQFPTNLFLIYSRKNLLDAIPMITAQRDFFKQIPVWTAGYPNDPDAYSSVPSFYIPDQTKWGRVYLWQYTDRGIVQGIEPNTVDCNWIDPVLVALLGDTTPPPASIPYGYTKTRRYESDVYIVKLESFDWALVTDPGDIGGRQTISGAAQDFGATYAINGDGRDANNRPLSLAASIGDLYNNIQFDYRPFVNFDRNGEIAITHILGNVEAYNLVSGTRYLVKGGVNQYTNSTDPEHITERHPRSAIGHTAEGKLILCVVDGRSLESAGVTLKELAGVMIEAGAAFALEMDGGGSSALWVNDRIVNVPSDGPERPVINHLLIRKEVNTMPLQYKVIWPNGVSKRLAPTTSSAPTGVTLAVNTVADVVQDNIPDQTYPNDVNKRWVKFTDGSYGASKYDTVRMELVSTPPPAGSINIDMTLNPDGTITGSWVNA